MDVSYVVVILQGVLSEIHEGHIAVVSDSPGSMCGGQEIEGRVSECLECQKNSRNPVKVPVHPWEQPGAPWK